MKDAEIKEGAKSIVEAKVESSVGMMVNLDHTIYFHRRREIRADNWLCTGMGDGTGRGNWWQVVCRRWVIFFPIPIVCRRYFHWSNMPLRVSWTCQKTIKDVAHDPSFP